MTTVLIAKSADEARAAKFSPKIVLCPENPNIDGASWNPTVLFDEILFKPCGEWIPEAHGRKTKHVARIQTLALALAVEANDGPIVVLSADVTPPDGWQERLTAALTDGVGMVAAVIPTGETKSIKAWRVGGKQILMRDDLDICPIEVGSAALDCCVLTVEAAKTIIPLSGHDLTEHEIGAKLAAANLKLMLHPLVRCLHG
jgi:hypothetical protein